MKTIWLRILFCSLAITTANSSIAKVKETSSATKAHTRAFHFGNINTGRLSFSKVGGHGKLIAYKSVAEARGQVLVQMVPDCLIEIEFAPGVYSQPKLVNTLDFSGISGLKLAFISMDEDAHSACDAVISNVSPYADLMYVNVDRSDTTDNGLRHLCAFKNLVSISAFGTAVKGDCLKDLTVLTELAHLNISSTPFDAKNLKYIPAMKKLKDLNLRQSGCDDASVKILSSSRSIQWLNLSLNKGISDKAIDSLCTMKSLKYVDLQQTSVTFDGLKKLSALPLTELNFSRNLLTAKQSDELKKLFPRTTLNALGGYNKDNKIIFAPLP